MNVNAAVEKPAAGLAGKYLAFHLGQETYGLELLKVQEIIGLTSVTSIPRTPHFVRGVINLRGKVIPVIDLRAKFDMEACEDTDRTCNIVVQMDHEVTLGVVVDEVSEVSDIAASQIEPPPSFGEGTAMNFMLGIAKTGEGVVMLLDIDKVLDTGELMLIEQVSTRS